MFVIYRIEHKTDGYGPYNGVVFHRWKNDRSHCEPRNPSPWDDELIGEHWPCLKKQHEYRFGFESIEQLKAWFDADELERMFSLGFEIVAVKSYKCQRIILGQKQVIFRLKKNAKNPKVFLGRADELLNKAV